MELCTSETEDAKSDKLTDEDSPILPLLDEMYLGYVMNMYHHHQRPISPSCY